MNSKTAPENATNEPDTTGKRFYLVLAERNFYGETVRVRVCRTTDLPLASGIAQSAALFCDGDVTVVAEDMRNKTLFQAWRTRSGDVDFFWTKRELDVQQWGCDD